ENAAPRMRASTAPRDCLAPAHTAAYACANSFGLRAGMFCAFAPCCRASLAPGGMGDNTSPISVILVSSGSRGNKLLFRYPFQRSQEHPASQTSKPRSRYAVNSTREHAEDQDGDSSLKVTLRKESVCSCLVSMVLFPSQRAVSSRRWAVGCRRTVFQGETPTGEAKSSGCGGCVSQNVFDGIGVGSACATIELAVASLLQANADPSVINCLHNLSRRIATVLQHEERRCHRVLCVTILAANDGPQSPFHHILPKCKLARDLKDAYDSLCTSGVVRLHVNSWLEVSFCLPHKIHYAATSLIPPEAIERSLKAIRPYHALLLLSDEKSLLGELPIDCSPALVRVIKTTSAVKNLQQLAQDADLALLQAIIIYPLCENNVYMLSPNASVCLYSPLAEQFSRQFPSHDLPSVLAKFSLPVSLSEFRNPLAPAVQETQLIQMVVWMLQHRLLVQLHTYVCLMASPSEDEPRPREDDVPLTTRVGGRSLSTPNALSFGSPTSSDDMTLTSPSMDNSSAELLPSGDSPLNRRMTENLLASLSEHERAAILSVPAAQNPEDLRMFASVLVVTTHEDPVITVFQALLT
ncbi:hypothetical protein E2I00_007271, partial [Balaenoptera physalus]